MSYQIRLKLLSGDGTEQIILVSHNQTQFMFTDLLPSKKYEVSVAAFNQVGSSGYTPVVVFTTTFTGTWLCSQLFTTIIIYYIFIQCQLWIFLMLMNLKPISKD